MRSFESDQVYFIIQPIMPFGVGGLNADNRAANIAHGCGGGGVLSVGAHCERVRPNMINEIVMRARTLVTQKTPLRIAHTRLN